MELAASTAYVVKDTLEKLQLSNARESRAVVALLDMLDRTFDFTALEGERQQQIDLLKRAQQAVADGKADEAQERLIGVQRYAWWKSVYASMDSMHKAATLVVPEQAVNLAADMLGKQAFDATGARIVLAFIDLVESARAESVAVAK
jgi:hypothetical protein